MKWVNLNVFTFEYIKQAYSEFNVEKANSLKIEFKNLDDLIDYRKYLNSTMHARGVSLCSAMLTLHNKD